MNDPIMRSFQKQILFFYSVVLIAFILSFCFGHHLLHNHAPDFDDHSNCPVHHFWALLEVSCIFYPLIFVSLSLYLTGLTLPMVIIPSNIFLSSSYIRAPPLSQNL